MSDGRFQVSQNNGTRIVQVIGDVDFSDRAELEDVLFSAQAVDAQRTVISFAQCSFCDSSVIGALMKLRNVNPQSDITLVAGDGTAVARVFELVGIGRVFPVVADEEGALKPA